MTAEHKDSRTPGGERTQARLWKCAKNPGRTHLRAKEGAHWGGLGNKNQVSKKHKSDHSAPKCIHNDKKIKIKKDLYGV